MFRLIVTLLLAVAVGCSAAPNPTPVANTSAAKVGQVATPATIKPVADANMVLAGKFSLTPMHGPWGTKVTAKAEGLTANTKYDLVWTSVNGSWKLADQDTAFVGREYKATQKPLASVTTDAQGSFSATFVVPDDFGFQHDVLVMDGGGTIRNKSGFDVDLQVSISPNSGPVGTPITVEAKGIGWRQLENSWQVAYDNKYTGWMSSVTSHGHAKFVIPATGQTGVHEITVVHGDFTFPFLNGQQSPEPDRPVFHIPFTITDGVAVLPPDPTRQGIRPQAESPAQTASSFSVNPPEGVVGSKSMVEGKGLPPSTEVDLTWSTVVGNRVSGGGWADQVKSLAKVKTDANGNLNWNLAVPDDLGGAHTIAVKIGDKTLAQTSFAILASAQKLSVDRGPSGTNFTIQLNGVGWTDTANIYLLDYDNTYAGYVCGFNSGGNVQIFMEASGSPGWHYIDLYPGIYKGKETRPVNFRVPQLTYADDHPGEHLPAFHFAFYITPNGTTGNQ